MNKNTLYGLINVKLGYEDFIRSRGSVKIWNQHTQNPLITNFHAFCRK